MFLHEKSNSQVTTLHRLIMNNVVCLFELKDSGIITYFNQSFWDNVFHLNHSIKSIAITRAYKWCVQLCIHCSCKLLTDKLQNPKIKNETQFMKKCSTDLWSKTMLRRKLRKKIKWSNNGHSQKWNIALFAHAALVFSHLHIWKSQRIYRLERYNVCFEHFKANILGKKIVIKKKLKDIIVSKEEQRNIYFGSRRYLISLSSSSSWSIDISLVKLVLLELSVLFWNFNK